MKGLIVHPSREPVPFRNRTPRHDGNSTRTVQRRASGVRLTSQQGNR